MMFCVGYAGITQQKCQWEMNVLVKWSNMQSIRRHIQIQCQDFADLAGGIGCCMSTVINYIYSTTHYRDIQAMFIEAFKARDVWLEKQEQANHQVVMPFQDQAVKPP